MYDPYYHFNVDADHTDDDVTGRLGTNWVKGTRAKVGYRDIRIYKKKKLRNHRHLSAPGRRLGSLNQEFTQITGM